MSVDRIRNFCIIAHIDHGKSTLADRLLETTKTISKRDMKDRTLDTLELEQERGITIKLQTARMVHEYSGEDKNFSGEYILNLIDTPGHVDFAYEVSRSVAACEGALLIVDVTQGIQAQTLSVMYKALEQNLKVIPVLNKVDLPSADTERVKIELMEYFGFSEDEMIQASGKTGFGADDILNAIVDRIPPPTAEQFPVQGMIFDSFFHGYKGVVALVKMQNGKITHPQRLHFIGTDVDLSPIEIGYLKPDMLVQNELQPGEVGYIATGLKDIKQIRVGDTVTTFQPGGGHYNTPALPGYKPAKPMVFASLYPVEASDFDEFADAVQKLGLNDAAFTYQRENSKALGSGFVCGFLGLLHLEIVQERLEREFNIDLISTSPTVEFKVELTTSDLSKIPNINTSHIDENGYLNVRTAAEYPDGSLVKRVLEPWAKVEIFTPEAYVGELMELCQQNRGTYIGLDFISNEQVGHRHAILKYEIPMVEIMVNFFDKMKSLSHGYASLDYNLLDYRPGNVVKVALLINGEESEALSFLVHHDFAERRARAMCEKLVEIIPRQNFKVPIQGAIGGKIIAREDIQAYRKDVTAKLYGGDISRKTKLLDKQKKGKKKMKTIGSVEIPKEAFLAALKTN